MTALPQRSRKYFCRKSSEKLLTDSTPPPFHKLSHFMTKPSPHCKSVAFCASRLRIVHRRVAANRAWHSSWICGWLSSSRLRGGRRPTLFAQSMVVSAASCLVVPPLTSTPERVQYILEPPFTYRYLGSIFCDNEPHRQKSCCQHVPLFSTRRATWTSSRSWRLACLLSWKNDDVYGSACRHTFIVPLSV